MPVVGLRCCMERSCGELGSLFTRCGLLIAVASLVAHRLKGSRASVSAALELSSCGA